MNRLPPQTRLEILEMVVDGESLGSISRSAGVSINTVTKLLRDVGVVCSIYLDRRLVELASKHVQIDAICTSRSGAKNRGAWEEWTWLAIDADTRLILDWMIGPCEAGTARIFSNRLASRFADRAEPAHRHHARTSIGNANLNAALAIHVMNHNYVRIAPDSHVTPAMAAGVADHVWKLQEIVNLGE